MQVVKNFLYNVSYQLLAIILPLITVPYVSKVLGAEGIGDYAFTYANMQYFVIFGMVGITLYGNRQIAYVRDNKDELKNTFFSIYTLQLITISISLTLYLIFALFLSHEYKLLYIAQGINILAAMADISWFFMGLEQFKKTVVRNTLVKLVSLASIFIFVRNSEDTVIYVTILGVSSLIGNLTFWVYIPKFIDGKKAKISKLNHHLKSSLALFVPQIAIQVYLLLDRTMLGLITNTVEVGYYENSQKIIKIALTFATAIGTVMMPKIANTVANGDMKKVKYYVQNSFFFMNALSIPLMFGLMGVANELSPWFYADRFPGIENLIVVSSVIILAISWSNVLGIQLLVPLNKTKEFTISVTSGAIVNFLFNLVMIRMYGAYGACISTVMAECSVTFVQLYFVRKIISPVKLIKPIILFIPSAIVMYIVVRVIGNYMGAGLLTNVVQVLAGAITYFIIVEIIYRILKKQSIVTYIKNIVKN